MSLDDEKRKTLVGLYLSKAEVTYEEMQIALKAEKWGMAANRLYYSVFHAATALFVHDGLTVGTHRGAKAMLGQQYVLTGIISTEYAKMFAQLETLRDKADYNIMFVAKANDVVPHLSTARDFIDKIKELTR